MGGPKEAADIINNAGKAAEKRIMPELTKLDKALARTIEAEMFKFEHLFVLDAKSRREERWLQEKFDDYHSYRQRVRRFIPWIY